MSISAEQNLKEQIKENKQRQIKISQILKDTYQKYQAEKNLDGCLNTLIAAIDCLQQEQKKAIDTNVLIAKQTTEQAEKILEKAEAIVSSIQSDKISQSLENFKRIIDIKNNELDVYLSHKLQNIENRDHFMGGDTMEVLKFLFYSIGAIGGITGIIKFFYNLIR